MPDRSGRACAALIEPLEDRRLLSANLDLHISFQPAGLPLVSGYVADSGALFGDQGNGLSYGWDADNAKNVRLHKTKVAPDLRYNTYALLLSGHKKGGHAWSISLPNDTYSVHLVVGDGSTGWKSEVDADGVVVVAGKATKKSRWLDNTVTVNVTDGVLTLVNGPKIKRSKLAFIDIQEIGTGSSQTTGGGDTSTTGSGDTTTTGGGDTTTTGGGDTGGTTPPPTLPALAWHTAAPGPIARVETQGATVGSRLYVIGGYYTTTPKWTATPEADAYDPATDTWQHLAPLPHAVTHAGVAAVGTDIWFAGGYTMRSDGEQNFASTDVFKYDTLTNTWSSGPSLPAARGAAVMIAVGQTLHLMGGVDAKRADHAEHWVLDLSQPNPTWVAAAPMLSPRNHLSGGVIGGKIYLAGGQVGYIDSQGNQKTLDIYDPATDTWSRGADLPKVRSHTSFSTVVVNNKLVVIGGVTANDVTIADVDEYDPATNTWTRLTSLPIRRQSPVAGYIGGRLIVTTGWDSTFVNTTFVSSPIT